MLKSESSGILCWLDIAKAYDCMNMSSLFKCAYGICNQMGWVDKMVHFNCDFLCLHFNGTSSGFFNNSEGLRLDEALSPCFLCHSDGGLSRGYGKGSG